MDRITDLEREIALLPVGYISRKQIHNWGKIYGELSIMYEGRLPD